MSAKVRELLSRAHEIASPRWEHPFATITDEVDREPPAWIASLPTGGASEDPLLLARVAAVHRRLASGAVPHVLPIVAVEHGDRVRLVYRRVEAESLSTVLHRGPLPLARALTIMRRLCTTLASAQRLGVDHRALGPGSVLLGPHGDGELWIADFGVADLLVPERAVGELELVPITPEQITGGATAISEDVYLLGCLAYWMLTGRGVFGADDLATLRRRHAIEDPLPLALAAGRELPPSLVAAITRALAKEPDERFTAFDELDAMLVRAEIESGLDGDRAAVTPTRTDAPHSRRVPPLVWTGIGAIAVSLPLLWSSLTTVATASASLPTVVVAASVAPAPCEVLPPVPGPLPAVPEPEPDGPSEIASFELESSVPAVAIAPAQPEPDVGADVHEVDALQGRARAASSPACAELRREAHAARERHEWSSLLYATSQVGCWRSIRARTKLRIKALMELKRFDACAQAVARTDVHDAELARWGELCKRRTATG